MNERERRSYVDRLRTSRGPSFDLLVQLDQHRVLTSGQVARLTAAAARTTSYRLDRLHAARLVEFARPGREVGSAPRHWWLTPAGARLVAGVAPAEGKRPSAMFAAHTSTIAEVWLALREHGPAVGITPTSWRPDRAGWQSWRTGYRGSGPQETVTPDAVLLADLTVPDAPAAGPDAAVSSWPTAALIEVDLGTETQTQLGRKIGRYLAYATDRAWSAAGLPHCPPLLLLTTTEARAVTWLRAAAKATARHRRQMGIDYRYRGNAAQDIAAAERLVIAACGLVRDPAAAVTGPVWQVAGTGRDDDDVDDQGVTLAALLAERVTTGRTAAAWHAQLAAEARQAARTSTLWDIGHDGRLAELLGDDRAAEVAYRLLAADDFTQTYPRLAELLLAWWPHRHDSRAAAQAAEIRRLLVDEHERIWAEQARAVLASEPHPRVAAAAATLLAGDLLTEIRLASLRVDDQDRADAARWQQSRSWYRAEREQAVTAQWEALPWRVRRRTDRAELAAAYDDARLLTCDTCRSHVPRTEPADPAVIEAWDSPTTAAPGDECPRCQSGRLLEYADRTQVPAPAARLDELRARLTG